MRPLDHNLVVEIVDNLDGGASVTRSEMISLLILLRESAPKGSALRDLGDAVAHRNRDRGGSFDYLNRWAQKWRMIQTHHYFKFRTDDFMPVRQVMLELNAALAVENLSVRLDHESHEMQCRVSDLVALAIDGTEFKLKGATGRLTAAPGSSHGAAIALTDDIRGAHGYVPGGIWYTMEWLPPEKQCSESCAHPNVRSPWA